MTVIVLSCAICIFLLVRNERVSDFRILMINVFFDNFFHDKSMMRKLDGMLSYDNMLFHFWIRLRIESFFNEETCQKIRNTDTYKDAMGER